MRKFINNLLKDFDDMNNMEKMFWSIDWAIVIVTIPFGLLTCSDNIKYQMIGWGIITLLILEVLITFIGMMIYNKLTNRQNNKQQ